MKIAISLLWIRHKASGGVESYSRNILDGFLARKDENQYFLICSEDNADSFKKYSSDNRFKLIKCSISTKDTKEMIFYESFKLDHLVTNLSVDLCFVPCYRMPLFYSRNKYVVVIHDLVAYWYPENFSFLRRHWLQWGWKRSIKKAVGVIVISDFVRKDIKKRYHIDNEKIKVIYNPILPNMDIEDFCYSADQYKIRPYEYFYTVSSTMKHKNLITLCKVMKTLISKYGRMNTPKLLISGVGLGGVEAKTHFVTNDILEYIRNENLEDICILTGFVSNERRNTLMKNAKIFLFSSLFEGFGMPPVEALEMGTPVVSTDCTALQEITQGQCTYVHNPLDVYEWIHAIESGTHVARNAFHFKDYEINNVTSRYLDFFNNII